MNLIGVFSATGTAMANLIFPRLSDKYGRKRTFGARLWRRALGHVCLWVWVWVWVWVFWEEEMLQDHESGIQQPPPPPLPLPAPTHAHIHAPAHHPSHPVTHSSPITPHPPHSHTPLGHSAFI
jgi:hypothetical protein